MKTLILPLLFIAGSSLSQVVSNEYVVSTYSRDTIFIINDSTGRLIFSSWDKTDLYTESMPVRILVADLEPYRKRLYNTKNKKQKG